MRNNQNRRTWGWIGAMTLLSFGITMTTMLTLRAFAQQPAASTPPPATAPPATAPPAPDEAGATGDALPEEEARRPAPPPILPPDPPELRESADNNISFPVDI
jgi:hypothetical protein